MILRARSLPREEWGRLAGTPLAPHAAGLQPGARILVVEDETGAIHGQWVAVNYLHAEGLWISDGHRGRGAVLARLLGEMRRTAEAAGVDVVMTAAIDDRVRGLITRVGGRQMPGDSYVFPVRGLPRCR